MRLKTFQRLTILLISCFLISGLSAQDFEVSPVLLNFNADPGEIQTRQIHIINHSSKIQKYNLKISDYVLDKNGKKKSVEAGSTKRSCADWVTINPSLLELNPNQTATIDAIITVPKDGFSTKWCMIFVEVAKEQTSFEADKALATGVMIVPRIVILAKQSPKSNTNYKATIAGLKEITKPSDKNRVFEAQVSNIGDNVIDGNVSLALANMETTQEQKFSPVKVTVYPDATLTVKLEIPNTIKKGKYALAAILDYGHRQPLSGTQMMLEVK